MKKHPLDMTNISHARDKHPLDQTNILRGHRRRERMPDQVYGFTPPGPNPGQEYVPFIQAFRLENGDFEVRVRNSSGVTNSIAIDVEEAAALAKALSAP